jgi:hypothetical protein
LIKTYFPDDCTTPIYVKYNDLLLQGTPEDVLQGIHDHHWTKYHATLMHEKLKHTHKEERFQGKGKGQAVEMRKPLSEEAGTAGKRVGRKWAGRGQEEVL